jgi:periplasmic protein CpxP/Spy
MNLGKVRVLAGASLLAFAIAAGAQTAPESQTTTAAPQHVRHMNRAAFRGDMFPFFSKQLGLTDEQHTQIKQIFNNAKPALLPLMRQERQAHQSMMQLITSGNFDQAKAQAIVAQETQVHAQIEMQHAQLASQAYQVLTPEQKTKLSEFMAQREQRFQHHTQDQSNSTPEQAPNQ